MSGEVPPMYWFLFWVGLAVGVLSFGFFMAVIIHRGNMKALEILRSYAEKGIEPPPAIVEMLARQIGDAAAVQTKRQVAKKTAQGVNIITLVVIAWVTGGIAWQRMDAGGPQWVVYLAAGIAVVFAIIAIRSLVAAITTSKE